MAALTPGARDGIRPAGTLPNLPRNPVLYISPSRAREMSRGKRPRPAYAPAPVGPSHAEIVHAKRQYCEQRDAIRKARAHVDHMEAALAQIPAQHVIACTVPGYTEPPERIAQAAADKAAGVAGPLTKEDGEKIRRGEMAPPKWDHGRPFYSEIAAAKQHVAHMTIIADHAEAHNDYILSDLHSLDPQAVVRAKVSDFTDPPEIVARALNDTGADHDPAK